MKLLLPSDNDNGTISSVPKVFETSRFYTIAEIIDDTVSFTQIRKGFATPPTPQKWVDIIRKLNVDAVVADSIYPETASALRSANVRLIVGARGLIGMLIDWVANLGLDDFESKLNLLNKPPVPPSTPKPAAAPTQVKTTAEPQPSSAIKAPAAAQGTTNGTAK
ncbi:MAG: hypothetical protein KIS30_01980 [Thermoplasmata archaeon]|nr:hypothetical protein [Candidatus Sysuiplasma acidicola]MBX8645515.1 hypothetical protein [Candidatus Sysuiplasma acidicola]MDH2904916.1 NifB/NifX family molybdenum-iron cluster-binding protein [Methanomassiliicoccales archaeon]